MTAESMLPPNADRLDALFHGDEYMGLIGAELLEWAGGRAVVRWTPRKEHRNFAGTVHGGAIFSLADAAFSIASNSWGRVCVALTVEIHYLQGPPLDTPLVAVGTERSRGRRSASYLIEVRPEADPSNLTASFHAMVHRTGRWHFGDAAWPEDWRSTH